MNCDFTLLKEDTGILLYIICAIALITVVMDVGVWRKSPECTVTFAHVQKANDPRLEGCK